MHDLSCETSLTRYTLRGVLRDPLSALAVGSRLGACGITAAGTLAGGPAAQQAGNLQATTALGGSEMSAAAAEAGGTLAADYHRRGAELTARSAEVGSEYAATAAQQGAALEAQAAEQGAALAARTAGDRAKLTARTRRQAGDMLATSQEQGGRLAQAEKRFEAAQAEMQAGEARGAAQRGVADRRRDVRLNLSALQARAAASGGGAADDTVRRLGARIAERGEYEALGEMFTGESRARGFENVA